MWVLHASDRSALYNISTADKISVVDNNIIITHERYGASSVLAYDDAEQARKGFGYLIDAIRRKDAVVSI
jgi:hypothetical protein